MRGFLIRPLWLGVFVAILVAPRPLPGQVAGQNVNMVSGTEWPFGDPFKQRQNEPSLAVSTRNPLHLLAGANDYRTVDIPFADSLPNAKVVGDAWLGLFKSFDGGQTWQSTLLPGYPQDTSPEGLASPIRRFSTAADPTVRAANSGLFHYSGIAFDRGTNLGKLFVTQYLDLANKENGRLAFGTDPIRYVRTVILDDGTGGQFLDKPWTAVDIPRGTGTCTFTVPTEAGPVTQTIPAGNVYAVYTVFLGNGNNIHTKLYFRKSTDCGATWSKGDKLSEGTHVAQGATVAVAPSTGDVYVAWRTFSAKNQANSIQIVRSTDGGKNFTKALTIQSLPDYNAANPTAPTFFDQGTTSTSFRTNAFPTMAIDAAGRVYVAWAQRGMGPHGDARIVMKTSADGVTWPSGVQIVDPSAVQDDLGFTFTRGHQLMPSLTFTGGKLMALYYDLRYDQTVGIFTPNNPFSLANGKFYFEERRKTGEWLLPNGENLAFTPFIDDAGLTARRHTIDVRVAQADPALVPAFTPAWVSQYRFGTRGDESNQVTPELRQLQVDPPNLPLFRQGTAPFFGDYIDIAGLTMRPSGPSGAWQFTTAPERAPVHYAVFTSNQDVRPPADGNWQNYTPPLSTGGSSLFDPTQQRPPCQPGNEGMRDQNIYVSRITQGLAVGAPQNAKQLTTAFQRNFPVTLQNATPQNRTFRLSIPTQPPGGFASFVPAPVPFNPNAPFSPVTTLDVTVGARAGAARSVYATSSLPAAGITVNVDEIASPGGPVVANGLAGFVLLNPEGSVLPPLLDPDDKPAGTSIQTVEIYTPNVSNPNVSNPNVSNPNVSNPNVSNPNVSNPNVSNPNVSNPNVSNPDIADPNVSNPNVSNPNVSNPNVSNPNVSNPNVSNEPVSDATYTITNDGNTAATYTIKLVNTGATAPTDLQLLVSKTYVVPVAYNCQLVQQTQTTTLVNVPDPVFTEFANLGDSTITDPSVSNPTFALGPGETALVTLRGSVPKAVMEDFITKTVPVSSPQVPNTNSPTNTPPIASPLFVATATLPDGAVGTGYAAPLVNLGGVAPFTWSLASGSLPAGLSIVGASIVGVPSGPPGTYAFTLQVSDSGAPIQSTSRSLTLKVVSSTLLVTGAPSNVVAGQPFSLSFQVQDDQGASIPGASISLAFGTKGCPAAILSGSLVSLSNVDGNVFFANVVIDRGGPGFTITATAAAPGFGSAVATTTPIFVEGFCATGPTAPARTYASLTNLADGRVLLAGGQDSGTTILGSAQVYDPATGLFTPTAGNLVVPRFGHQAVLLPSGRVLIVGGSAGGGPTATAEIFDPATMTFAPAAGSMSVPRIAFRATWVPAAGKVLITGGQNTFGFLSSAEVFDPATGVFSATGVMTTARELHTATPIPDGRVLVAGGAGGAFGTAELWNPVTGAFSAIAPMAIGRDSHEALALSDGRILLVGGESGVGGAPLASAEIFDPATGLFALTAPMAAARTSPLVAPLPSGKVLVAGGYGPGSVELTSAEVFNPLTATFTATGSLVTTQGAGGAVLLSGGRVLVAGSDQFNPNGELFHSTASACDPVALAAAVAAAGGTTQTINLSTGCIYSFTSGSSGDPSTALPHVTAGTNLTINGNGATIERLGVAGVPAFRLFAVDSGATLTLNGVTIRNGGCGLATVCPNLEGGGVLVSGTLNVVGTTFSANDAGGDLTDSRGGAIESFGAVSVDQSTFRGNRAQNNGGAIFNFGTSLSVTNSTFVGNHARNVGGAITAFSQGPSTVTNSTFVGNTSLGVFWAFPSTGSALYNQNGPSWGYPPSGPLTVTNSTFFGNGAGGAITTEAGVSTVLRNSVLADSAGANCAGPNTDGGYNISSDATCAFAAAGSLNSTDPLLDPAGLSPAGGPTQVVVPLPGSPAVDAIPPGTNGCGTSLTTDQRGATRPTGTGCDIGAVEFPPVIWGWATLTNIKLNGGTNVLTLPGGGAFTISHDYTVANDPSYCPGCIDQIEIGLAVNPPICVYNGIPFPPQSGTVSTSLTAPSAPGVYYIGMDWALNWGCFEPVTPGVPVPPYWNSGPPGPNRYIGKVIVNSP